MQGMPSESIEYRKKCKNRGKKTVAGQRQLERGKEEEDVLFATARPL